MAYCIYLHEWPKNLWYKCILKLFQSHGASGNEFLPKKKPLNIHSDNNGIFWNAPKFKKMKKNLSTRNYPLTTKIAVEYPPFSGNTSAFRVHVLLLNVRFAGVSPCFHNISGKWPRNLWICIRSKGVSLEGPIHQPWLWREKRISYTCIF